MAPLSLVANPQTALIIGALAISFSGVWVKIAEVSADTSAFYRALFGFCFLLAIALARREKIIPQPAHLLLGLLCGILFALDLICWHRSILLIGPGLATILGNFQVFILAGVGILFLQERYSYLLLLAIPLAVAGLFLVVGAQWQAMGADYAVGIYYGLATAVLYASYILALRLLSARCREQYLTMLLASFFTAAVLGIFLLYTGDSFAIPDAASLASLLSLGLLSQCLGWLLIAASLPRIAASLAGLTLLLQPALAFIWDVTFFHRPTDFGNWTGVVLTLAAIYCGLYSKHQAPPGGDG